MRLLLDTHLLLWIAFEPNRISSDLRNLLEDKSNIPTFSVVSIWEVTIKRQLERADFLVDARAFRRGLIDAGYDELSVLGPHVLAVAGLPRIHGDPFDRLLVGQCIAEGMTLLISHKRVTQYPGPIRLIS